jgi:AcrR family transcriptional regulator
MVTSKISEGRAPARDRIMESAYELFSARGIRDVGIEELISRSDVAKATFYRHFPSKDDLVLTFLHERDRVWTRDLVDAGARGRASDPQEQLLAIFDVFDDWFRHRKTFEACSFINVLLEMGANHPIGVACIRYLANIRTMVRRLAEEAGLTQPEEFAHSWHILMKGSIISAVEGDVEAARRAQEMARHLLARHQPANAGAG